MLYTFMVSVAVEEAATDFLIVVIKKCYVSKLASLDLCPCSMLP